MEAKDFLNDKLVAEYFRLLLVNFARYHVEEALKAASELCKIDNDYRGILNAYPLKKIK